MEREDGIKIIFWGTPEFALPSLEALIENGYNIVAIVANPDEPVGRKNIITPPPVKVLAEKHNIPVFQPDQVSNVKGQVSNVGADLFVVAAYGKIIPKDILNIPKYGALNIHPSLLPRWRGPSPIQSTILNGDTEAGVTIMKMDELMDHGPAIVASSFQLPVSSKPTYEELHDKLSKLGAEFLIETLPKYLQGEITPVPQNDSKATYSKILKKDDGRIDWKKSAEEIERMVRAFTPWPGAWTIWPSSEKIYRLRIEKAAAVEEEIVAGGPGYVTQVSGEKLERVRKPHIRLQSQNFGSDVPRLGLDVSQDTPRSPPGRLARNSVISPRKRVSRHALAIKTGKGLLVVEELTLEGRKKMQAAAFLRGHPELMGSMLV